MGYAGYSPGHKLPDSLSSLQQALKAVQQLDSLDVMAKLTYNVACMPQEAKYRSIKLTNKKIAATIVEAPGAMDAMREMGWVQDGDELQCTKNLTMAQFRDIEAAKDTLQKDIRRAEVAQLRANT